MAPIPGQHPSIIKTHSCQRCKRRFSTKDAKKRHTEDSQLHNICRNRHVDFEPSSDLTIHAARCRPLPARISQSQQGKPSEPLLSRNAGSIVALGRKYNGIATNLITPVYKTALKLMHEHPTVASVKERVQTTLDTAIITCLISAALRLLPVLDTPEGRVSRVEAAKIAAEEAQMAEDGFLDFVARMGYRFLSEKEQHQVFEMAKTTPDIRFIAPQIICGQLCFWLEYKSYFGFRASPFIASKNRRQLGRYARELGPGAVVYRVGYETNHLTIEGVTSLWEDEVRNTLTAAVPEVPE